MQGRALAQDPAQQPAGIATGTARMTLEEFSHSFGGQRGEAHKVNCIDRASDRSTSLRPAIPPAKQDRRAAERATCGRCGRWRQAGLGYVMVKEMPDISSHGSLWYCSP